jgi:hypothetical protein
VTTRIELSRPEASASVSIHHRSAARHAARFEKTSDGAHRGDFPSPSARARAGARWLSNLTMIVTRFVELLGDLAILSEVGLNEEICLLKGNNSWS